MPVAGAERGRVSARRSTRRCAGRRPCRGPAARQRGPHGFAAGAPRRPGDESGEQRVDHRRRGLREIVGFGACTHSCITPTMKALRQRAASRVSVSRGSCPASTACVSSRSTLARHPLSVACRRPATDANSRREFAFVEDDVEHRLRARIGGEAHEAVDRERAQRAERILLPDFAGGGEHRLHRQLHALAQRLEQRRLVAEVPVDGAARDARRRGDSRRATCARRRARGTRAPRRRAARRASRRLPFWCVSP